MDTRKTKVICFANNKGGSGKSTSCSNVGYALAEQGKKVLLVDADMQLNLTLSVFSEDEAIKLATSEDNIYSVLIKNKPVQQCIKPTAYNNLDILASTSLMSGVEYELFTKWQREFTLKKALAGVIESGEYDYILLDAPPTLGCLVMNLLCVSDYLIIPLEASPWGLFGLANMFDFVEKVGELNPNLKLLGVLVTKVDTRKNYYKQTIQQLSELNGVRVFDTVIRLDSAIEWSQDNSKPVMAFRRSSRSAAEYLQLSKEIEKYSI